MKTKQMVSKRIPGILSVGLLMGLVLLAGISCTKNSSLPVSPVSLQSIATKLDGEVLTGSIFTEGDEEGLALWCHGGKTLIGIEKIPSQGFTDPGKIEHAQVVYSSFGIIIHDTDTNKLWYYIQNDEKSQAKFQLLSPTGSQPVVSGIAGTIKLNL